MSSSSSSVAQGGGLRPPGLPQGSDEEEFRCPRCGTLERSPNALAAARLRRAGRCQGCRALDTLYERPWLLPHFVSFWKIVGFPASDAWLRQLASSGDQGEDAVAIGSNGAWEAPN